MKRVGLLLIVGAIAALAGCDLTGATVPSDGIDEPAGPTTYTYVFRNESGYYIDVLPASGQTWDSVTLPPSGGIKTYELEIEPDTLNFTWSNAQATNVAADDDTAGSRTFTFTDATMYTYRFYNNSSIHLVVWPENGQIWQGFNLFDYTFFPDGMNEYSLQTKYADMQFRLEKLDGVMNHADDSVTTDQIRITSEMGYDFFLRDPE